MSIKIGKIRELLVANCTKYVIMKKLRKKNCFIQAIIGRYIEQAFALAYNALGEPPKIPVIGKHKEETE